MSETNENKNNDDTNFQNANEGVEYLSRNQTPSEELEQIIDDRGYISIQSK